MPLRDHFRPPVMDRHSWDELLGGWPMKIVESLVPVLPPGYLAAPHIHLGGAVDLPDVDEYEVRVYDATRGRRLVAAVELVSPSNKDRPETRQALVAKCAALLRQQVSVTIVDLVTIRESNLYADLLSFLKQTDPSLAPRPSITYAVTCRGTQPRKRWLPGGWHRPLILGQPLPKLPLWLTDDLAVDLDLETSYEQTCRVLQIA